MMGSVEGLIQDGQILEEPGGRGIVLEDNSGGDFAAGFARRGNAVHQQRQLQAVGHAQFLETADRWALTVRSVMPSASAIWALAQPPAA